jgi:hypothetical protein
VALGDRADLTRSGAPALSPRDLDYATAMETSREETVDCPTHTAP